MSKGHDGSAMRSLPLIYHNAHFVCKPCRKSRVVQWNHPMLEEAQACDECAEPMLRTPPVIGIERIIRGKPTLVPHHICACAPKCAGDIARLRTVEAVF